MLKTLRVATLALLLATTVPAFTPNQPVNHPRPAAEAHFPVPSCTPDEPWCSQPAAKPVNNVR